MEILLEPTSNKLSSYRQAKDHDIKFYCSNDIKSKIKIPDHKHAEGTAKNSQDNKVLRLEEVILEADLGSRGVFVMRLPSWIFPARSYYQAAAHHLVSLGTFGRKRFEFTTKSPEKLVCQRKYQPGDKGLRSEGTKLIQIFIKAELPEKGVKRIIPENKETRQHKRYVVPFPFKDDHLTSAFIGQTGSIYPIGTIDLNVTMGEPGKLRTVTMEFAIVKSHSPYNVILGRTSLRSLGAVASAINSMIKFPIANGIALMKTKRETLQECRKMEKSTRTDRQDRESDEFIQPSPIPSEKDAQGHGKGMEKDELLEKLPEGKPPEKDEENMAYHTDEGVFCYAKMLFGLKNSIATYQRLVDTIFKGKMGRNLEAYVDDMVIKSKTGLEMIKDVEETLLTLKKTIEAEEAFQTMKKLIDKMPTLTAPKKERELMVYLSAANEVVSVVLLVEREGRQTPIHYVSRTLQSAKIHYLPMEKLALALVDTARWLRMYF
uniref:Reverse transcriptase/retrotransposon-derived protein RNase H-like domain-containing protein n=1 Tax=Tanacetum cinerariifolium TaxID=118510 RepID=A0A699GRA4_TANCI|nr:hypothetical protein [Tanacetum cinerariifolium]